MAYIINRFDGTQLSIVDDGVLDNSTSLGLIGRNYTGYGETQNENFVFLLENFANNAPPTRALRGQIWYNTTEKTLKTYNGTVWLSIGNATVAETDPAHSNGGLWLKSTTNQLYVSDGTVWRQVGPEGVDGFAVTKMTSTKIRDVVGAFKPVIITQLNGTTTAIFTNEAFEINAEDSITGFSQLENGINIRNDSVVHGSLKGNASSATRLLTSRTINDAAFDGTSNITVTAATNQPLKAGDYIIGSEFNGAFDTTWDIDASPDNLIGKIVARDSTGGFTASRVIADEFVGELLGNVSTISGVSTFNNIVVDAITGTSFSGLAARATQLSARRTINTVAFDGTENIILPVPAETLTGNTLAANIVASSLTSLGQLEFLNVEAPGITIGDGNNLNIKIEGFTPTIESDTTNIMKFKLATGGVAVEPTTLTFLSASAAAADGVTAPAFVPDYILGTTINNRPVLGLPSHRWRNIYSKAATLDTLNVTTLSGRTVDDQVVVSNNLAVTGAMYGAVVGTLTGSVTGAASLNLLKSGDGMSGDINWSTTGRGLNWTMNTDGASIRFYNVADGDTDARLEFNTSDNNNEYYRWTHTSSGTTYESMRLTPNASGLANLRVSGQITVVGGGVSAATYIGDANQLTNLNATQILTGTVPAARLTGSYNINVVGNLTGNVAGNVTGNTQGVHTGSVVGNATTATTWATGRTITLTGDVTGVSAAFDGSGNLSFATTIAANSVALGTDTTGQYASTVTVSGTGLSATAVNADDGTAYTITSNATSANTGNTLVSRAANGNFDAGTITATFSGNITGNVAGNVTGAASLNVLKTGDAMTGDISWSTTGRGLSWGMNSDGASIRFYNTGDGDAASRLEFQTTDNGNEYFSWTHALSGGGTIESMRLVPNSSSAAVLTVFGNATINGTTTGTFSGVGTSLTLNAANLTTGTVPSARLTGTYAISISGNANTATSAGTATNQAGGSVNATTGSFSGRVGQSISGFHAASKEVISTRTDSGFFDWSAPTTANGWPVNGSWHHLLSSTHVNDANYYAMQFSADFYSQNLYYRSTGGNGATAWNKILHANNFNDYAPTKAGGGATGTWSISITGNSNTVTTLNSGQIVSALGFTPVNPGALTNQSGSAINGSTATFSGQVNVSTAGIRFPTDPYGGGGDYASITYESVSGEKTRLRFTVANDAGITSVDDKAEFIVPDNDSLLVNGHVTLNAANYNNYAPTKAGGGATGTWSINVTGSADSAGTVAWTGITGKPNIVLNDGGTYGINISGNANTASSTPVVSNSGNVTAETDGTGEPSGLRLRSVYSNGYPTSYGNAITLGGAGGGELLVGWSGSTGAHADNYVRSRRDTGNTWSAWAKLITDVNYNSYSPTLTGGGASGTWAINITGNAVTVSAITSTQVTNALGYTPVNPSTLTNQSGSNGQFNDVYASNDIVAQGKVYSSNTFLTGVGSLTPDGDIIENNAADISDAIEYLKLVSSTTAATSWNDYTWMRGNWGGVGSKGYAGVFCVESNAQRTLSTTVGTTPGSTGDTMLVGNVTPAGLFYNGLMISENGITLKGKNIIIDSDDGVAVVFTNPISANVTGNLTGNASTVTTVTSGQITSALGYTPANGSGAGLINGEQNYQDFNLKRATIIDYSLAHNALGNVSGSTSLNMELGNYVSATAVGAVTWSFTNPPTSSSGVASRAGSIILELTNGGAYTQYWPAATRWPAGTAPSLTSSGVDVLVFITDDAGTNWRGAISMSDSR